ncbi:hypothetical protein M5689_023805 [Euphorbia peplus]|nr:hypothetical protein M5689_023805 [Euphorbia peplus]
MESTSDPTKPICTNESLTAESYPVPLSPPLPSISKEIEVARAMSAASRKTLFSLSRNDVLYEDQWLIAVNKPQGIYCETVLESIPSLLADSTASTGVIEGFKDIPSELHLANRLDRDTSGVMVITKLHKVAAKLVKAFTDHKVKKTYIARCVGSAPKWKKITIKSGHGRSKFGAWRVYASSDVGRTLPGGSSVRYMETSFEVLSIIGQQSFRELPESEFEKDGNFIVVEEKALILNDADSKKDEILVRAVPRSGRTHQIRLHCQYLGISIRGDVKYEGVYEWKGNVFDGHELHAESLSFEHPVTGLPIMFSAPLPSWVGL